MLMFASALPENADGARWARFTSAGRCTIKTRKELLATIKPHQWQFLRADTGDMPEPPAADKVPPPQQQRSYISLVPTPAA